jgi:hypothetical protein
LLTNFTPLNVPLTPSFHILIFNFPAFRNFLTLFKIPPPKALKQISLKGASLVRGKNGQPWIDFGRILLENSGLNNQFDLGSPLLCLHANGIGTIGTEVFILITFR